MPQDNNLMSTNSNSYKSIMKGTAIFGGTQFFAILVNLIRGKLVALFLGVFDDSYYGGYGNIFINDVFYEYNSAI